MHQLYDALLYVIRYTRLFYALYMAIFYKHALRIFACVSLVM